MLGGLCLNADNGLLFGSRARALTELWPICDTRFERRFAREETSQAERLNAIIAVSLKEDEQHVNVRHSTCQSER